MQDRQGYDRALLTGGDVPFTIDPLDKAIALAALDMAQIWFWLALVYLKALALFGYNSDVSAIDLCH